VILVGAFIGLGLVWITGFALVASAAAGWLRRRVIRRAITAITGTVLVLFGARLATEPR
jgi:threonine/homoserine/homoserine lactone efflux protein